MNRRSVALAVAAGLIIIATVFLVLRQGSVTVQPSAAKEDVPAAGAGAVRRSITIDQLADKAVTPQEKVRRIYILLQNYQQALRNRGGPPLSSNRDFTTALTGRNALKIRFLPPDHPSISAGGELLDAWDTPYVFHALSADSIEVQSAGPDRIAFTRDDIVFPPPRPRDSLLGAIRSRGMPEEQARPGRPQASGSTGP